MVLRAWKWRALILVTLLGLSSRAVFAWSTLDDWALVVATQMKSKAPLPALSNYGAALTLADAYAVQRRVVEYLIEHDKVAGYRACLTRPRAQVEFNVREPITGVILNSSMVRGTTSFKLHEFKRLMLAPALGYVLKNAVTAPLSDISQVEKLIGAVVPVIEFADYRFDSTLRMRGEDFAANNAALARTLTGRPFEHTDAATINGVITEMAHADSVIDRGRAINVMGSQNTALYWLVNQLLKQGWQLPANTLLVTGAMSDPVRAELGHYAVTFGNHGVLDFEIER